MEDFPLEEAHQKMRDDMNLYFFPEMKEIQKLLSKENTSFDILNISSKTLLRWKEKQLSLYQDFPSCKYITEDVISSLCERVYQELLTVIEP